MLIPGLQNAGSKAVRTIGHRHADRCTLALAGAVLFERVLRRFHSNVVVGGQQQVVAGLDIAAAHQDVAVFATTGGDQVDVATGLQGGTLGGGATLLGLALALAAAHGDRDADIGRLGRALGGVGIHDTAGGLTRAIGAVGRRRTGQGLHARVAFGFLAGLTTVHRRLGQIECRCAQGDRQAALLELGALFAA